MSGMQRGKGGRIEREMTALSRDWIRAAIATLNAIRNDGLAADATDEIYTTIVYLQMGLAEIEGPDIKPLWSKRRP